MLFFTYPFICPSVHPSVRPSVHPSVRLSSHQPSIYLYLSVSIYIYLFTCFVHLAIFSLILLSIQPSIHITTCISVYTYLALCTPKSGMHSDQCMNYVTESSLAHCHVNYSTVSIQPSVRAPELFP
jgi:hypothetical protein